MTRTEFSGQFDRLCRGFKHEPTTEQGEAWYRRIGHVALSVWAEVVTTLLCGKYFPKLDEVLSAIEVEADNQRRAAVERDKTTAARVHRRLDGGHGCPLSADLFAVIRALAARDQVRHLLTVLPENPDLDPAQLERRLAALRNEEARIMVLLADRLPKLNEPELTALVARYGPAVAA